MKQITDFRLYEISFVSVPANPACVVVIGGVVDERTE